MKINKIHKKQRPKILQDLLNTIDENLDYSRSLEYAKHPLKAARYKLTETTKYKVILEAMKFDSDVEVRKLSMERCLVQVD